MANWDFSDPPMAGPQLAPKAGPKVPVPMYPPMTGPTLAPMARSVRLGILVPSSNTALEPLTQAIIASLDDISVKVSVHFARFPVTDISMTPESLAQFSILDDGSAASPVIIRDDGSSRSPIMAAARLLADAHVDVIGFSGTAGGWLGFDADEALCAAITKGLGVPATTSTLALQSALTRLGVRDVGLVTPYKDDVQARILDVFKDAGYRVVAERHLGESNNAIFAAVRESTLDEMVQMVFADRELGAAAAITTFCTNLVAAQRVQYWENRFNIPVLDSVATVIWDMLRICRVKSGAVKGWGKLFDL